MFLNVGVCFVRVPLERDALQFVLNPHGDSVLTVYVRCKRSFWLSLLPILCVSMTIRELLPHQFFELNGRYRAEHRAPPGRKP
jgi:hypothetical protein